jgi:hypothetical protein
VAGAVRSPDLKWEQEFRCEGVETLADFKAVIEEVNEKSDVFVRSVKRSHGFCFAPAAANLTENTGNRIAEINRLRNRPTSTKTSPG